MLPVVNAPNSPNYLAQTVPLSLPPETVTPDAVYVDLGNAKSTIAGALPAIATASGSFNGSSSQDAVVVKIYYSADSNRYYVYGMRRAEDYSSFTLQELQSIERGDLDYEKMNIEHASSVIDSQMKAAVERGDLPRDTKLHTTITYIDGAYLER
jgi:hypothetical protein